MNPAPTHLAGDDEALAWLGEHLIALVALARRRDPGFTSAGFSQAPQQGPALFTGTLTAAGSKQATWDLASAVPTGEPPASGAAMPTLSCTSYQDEIDRLMLKIQEIISKHGPTRVLVAAT